MNGPAVQLSRRYRFSASHRLHVDHLDAARNQEIFGKCNNPFGHGHNYFLQVTVTGPVDPVTGMVVDLARLDSVVQERVLERFDHANLNLDPSFTHKTPSTEHLAQEIWRIMASFTAARVVRIRVEETANNSFDYFGETNAVLNAHTPWAQEGRIA